MQGQDPSSSSTPVSVHDRIAQLESLVTSLIDASKHGRDSAENHLRVCSSPQAHLSLVMDEAAVDGSVNIPAQLSGEYGRLTLTSVETTYVENLHWTAVLDGVRLGPPRYQKPIWL